MYLLAAETEIYWELGVTEETIILADLDLIIINPLGESEYLVSPIDVARFQAPTPTVPGFASYLFTPQLEGLWKIRLVKGTPLNYLILSKVEMWVFDSTQIVAPLHQLKNTISDEKSLTQPSDLRLLTGEIRWYPTRNIEIRKIFLNVGTPPTGREILIGVNKNGVSILNSSLSIAPGSNEGIAQIPLDQYVTKYDYITVDVLQLGSIVPGSNLFVNFKYD